MKNCSRVCGSQGRLRPSRVIENQDKLAGYALLLVQTLCFCLRRKRQDEDRSVTDVDAATHFGEVIDHYAQERDQRSIDGKHPGHLLALQPYKQVW